MWPQGIVRHPPAVCVLGGFNPLFRARTWAYPIIARMRGYM